ncbi:MAG: riboflavin biosynthesis protein RibF [Candidatus Magasanikbacteria bacterium]|nr:riboflavin biosynthesis protein RibF [Candidatus Magasanikbacteria bacterium]
MKIFGHVIHGAAVGRTLGYPTINLAYETGVTLKTGVWGGVARFDGAENLAAIVIGGDFEKTAPLKLEAHLLDFTGDLYGKVVELELLFFVRPLARFSDGEREKLIAQIAADIQKIKYVHGNRYGHGGH